MQNGMDILRQIAEMGSDHPSDTMSDHSSTAPNLTVTFTDQQVDKLASTLQNCTQQITQRLDLIYQAIRNPQNTNTSLPETPPPLPSNQPAAAQPSTPQPSPQTPIDPLPRATMAMKPKIRFFGDWYLIERICYEHQLIRFAHLNDHATFIECLKHWNISITKKSDPKQPDLSISLDANHLSKGAGRYKLTDTSRFPDWKTTDHRPIPDSKLNLIRHFLSLLNLGNIQ